MRHVNSETRHCNLGCECSSMADSKVISHFAMLTLTALLPWNHSFTERRFIAQNNYAMLSRSPEPKITLYFMQCVCFIIKADIRERLVFQHPLTFFRKGCVCVMKPFFTKFHYDKQDYCLRWVLLFHIASTKLTFPVIRGDKCFQGHTISLGWLSVLISSTSIPIFRKLKS